MMSSTLKTALNAPRIFDGEIFHDNAAILIEDNLIQTIVSQDNIPAEYQSQQYNGLLLPGMIDLQVNGGGGVLFNDEPTISGLNTIITAHRQRGTAALLPTLITADDKTISNALNAVAEGIKDNMPGLLGIHIEGPMINPKRKGIHKLENIRTLSAELIDEICHYQNFTRIVTLAPEMVSLSLIEKLNKAGVIVFAGHTEASPSCITDAIAAGLKGFTHLYNAMPKMESRNPGTTGYAIQSNDTYASIIHDTFHVDPLMVKLAYQSKPKGKLFLVSDAMSSIGSNQSHFILDDQTIYVQEGRLTNSTGTLAGAHVDMVTSVLNSAHLLDIPLCEALAMGTSIPAKVIDNNRYGLIKNGYQAFINEMKGDKIIPIFSEITNP